MRLAEALNIKEEPETPEPLAATPFLRFLQSARDWFRLVVELAFH
jgi:hypothetical protein